MRKLIILVPYYIIGAAFIVYCICSNQWAALVSAITTVISVSIVIIFNNNKHLNEGESSKSKKKYFLKLFTSSITTTSLCLFAINEFLVQFKWLTYFSIAFLFIAVVLSWIDFVKTLNDTK